MPVRPAAPAAPLTPARGAKEEAAILGEPIIGAIEDAKLVKQPMTVQPALPSVGSLRGLSRAELRRAIVLNEVLGPPLALRES